MTVTATFDCIEEIMDFVTFFGGQARVEKENKAPAQVPVQMPVQAPAPAQAIPVPTVVPAPSAPTAPVTTPVQASAPVQTAVPTSTPQYKLDDLARAAMTLMDSGRQADLQGLLARFGVEALPMLPLEQYGAFATALREMGAQI